MNRKLRQAANKQQISLLYIIQNNVIQKQAVSLYVTKNTIALSDVLYTKS